MNDINDATSQSIATAKETKDAVGNLSEAAIDLKANINAYNIWGLLGVLLWQKRPKLVPSAAAATEAARTIQGPIRELVRRLIQGAFLKGERRSRSFGFVFAWG